MAETKFRVGVRGKDGLLKHAFRIERREDGGIRLSNIKRPLSDSERSALFRHFGTPLEGVTGGSDGPYKFATYAKVEKPGTVRHFHWACKQLPKPFTIMADNYEQFFGGGK